MERYALQLKVSLIGIKPLIWRRVIVNADMPLGELHEVIQTIMPWDDGHLHRFYNKEQIYMMPYEECEYPENIAQMEAYEDALIEDVLTEKGQRLKYEYDFGDSWIHDILVEAILPPLESRDAIFVKGKNAAPPEDCGGIWGYEHFREVMSNPKHPEYEDMLEWLGLEKGEVFDPTDIGCTIEDINDMLSCDPIASEGGIEMLEKALADDKLPVEFREGLMYALSKLKKDY